MARGEPPVRAEPAEVDFGDVRPGSESVVSVRLTNSANYPVHVRSVRASCECTATSLDRSELEAGGEATMTLRFSTDDLGARDLRVVVTFKEPIPPVRVVARAHVNHGIRFGVERDAEGGRELVLESVVGRAFRVVSVDGVAAPGAGEASAVHRVALDEGGSPMGATIVGTERWIVAETDDPESALIVLPRDEDWEATRSVARPWTVSGEVLVGETMSAGETAEFEVTLVRAGVSSLETLERLEVSSSGAEAGVMGMETTTSGVRVRLYLRPRLGARGLVSASFAFTAREHTETVDVFARVVGGGSSADR